MGKDKRIYILGVINYYLCSNDNVIYSSSDGETFSKKSLSCADYKKFFNDNYPEENVQSPSKKITFVRSPYSFGSGDSSYVMKITNLSGNVLFSDSIGKSLLMVNSNLPMRMGSIFGNNVFRYEISSDSKIINNNSTILRTGYLKIIRQSFS